MRKQTKLVAVMSAAALLAIGASMTSFAATKGWVEENGVWMYLDSDGDAVTEEWKKSGSQYFWLDENGEMAIDCLVEDDDDRYYVDANGARVLNQWRQVDNEDGWTTQDDDDEPETVWYYFGSNGKAFKDAKKTINGKTYFFDEEGEMHYGWYEHVTDSGSKNYYLGEENEGWAYTGWQWLELKEDITDDYDDDEYWFHFKSNGEMRIGKVDEDKRQYINGAYYGFDENGVMVDGWRPAPESGSATSTAVKFYTEDNGNQPKGWIFTYTYEDWDDQSDDEQWFYLDSKGKPFNVGGYWGEGKNDKSTAMAYKIKEGDVIDKRPDSDKNRYTGVSAKYIKKKTYMFGSDGVMLTGVIELVDPTHRVGGSSSTLLPGYYYFNKNGGSQNGQMETGKVTVNYDGENFYYNFSKSTGKAYTSAIVDGCIYDAKGVRIDADESKEVLQLNMGEHANDVILNNGTTTLIDIADAEDKYNVCEIVVSSSGKIKKNGTVTIDGQKITVKDYVVTDKEDK